MKSPRCCSRCGWYIPIYSNDCSCRLFECRMTEPWYGDLEECYARDARCAAETIAKRYNEDSADYPMMSGGSSIVVLIDDPGETSRLYEVTAEPRIEYYVRELKQEKPE